MSQLWKKESDDNFAATMWNRFRDGAWVWGAAVALVVLISLSRVIIL